MEKYTYEELFTLAREMGVESCDFDEWIDEQVDKGLLEDNIVDRETQTEGKENNMKKLICIGVEKDYNERDLDLAAYGFPGCMSSRVYVDPNTGEFYYENFWGDLAPIEFPWKTVVVYDGSSEHVPVFMWEDDVSTEELEDTTGWNE